MNPLHPSQKKKYLRTIMLCSALVVGSSVATVFAYPEAKQLIDATPQKSILIHLKDFYDSHPVKPGQPNQLDTVFDSPRCKINLITNHGPLIGRHIHMSVDEIVFVVEGQGEMYLNGEWVPVKAGDFHVCPRGVAHATRVTGDKDMKVISVFTSQPTGGNDRIMLDD